jgi:hypothetical protein
VLPEVTHVSTLATRLGPRKNGDQDAAFCDLFNLGPTCSKMVAMSRRALVAAGVLGAALCFSLGFAVSRVVDQPKREPTSTPSSKPMSYDEPDGGDPGPLLLIDPSKVTLLPDAALTLEPPAPLDLPR